MALDTQGDTLLIAPGIFNIHALYSSLDRDSSLISLQLNITYVSQLELFEWRRVLRYRRYYYHFSQSSTTIKVMKVSVNEVGTYEK